MVLRGALVMAVMLAATSQAGAAVRPAASHVVFRPIAPTPDLAPALFAKLATRLTPAGRSWVEQMSGTLRSGELQPDGVQGMAAQVCRQMLQSCTGAGDVAELAFVVLMQASQDQADDLKEIMAGVKAINAQKSALRSTRRVSMPRSIRSSRKSTASPNWARRNRCASRWRRTGWPR